MVFSSSFFFLVGYPWKRESLVLRLLCGFFFQFLFLDGIPLEKGVLKFEIALELFYSFFGGGNPWKRES